MSLGSRLIYAVIQHQNQPAYAALEKLEFAKRALASVRPNAAFRRKHPDFPVPPVYLLWDAQSYTDYEKYRSSGAEAASLYWQLMLQYTDPGLGKVRVCEWGCGPARIIRHLPKLSRQDPRRFEFYGTDYNAASIGWCQRSLPEIAFKRNRLAPPLDFEDGFFDVLFCRSVFTHLSEEMHYAWIRELSRVVKHGGVLMVSTQGRAHRERLLPDERARFDQGELIIRKLADEGKLNFSAFHPSQFVQRRLLQGFEILEHREGRGTQDLWIVRNAGQAAPVRPAPAG